MASYLSSVDAPAPALDIRRNLVMSGLVFLFALALALIPQAFDRPVTRLINEFANRSWLFDYFTEASSKYFTFSGVIMMAMIWYCWFEKPDTEHRVRILVGTLASIGAGAISRTLQHEIPTHPRPYYDAALGFQLPLNYHEVFNNWNSFPSDHVAVFAGLAVVLYIVRPSFVIYPILWITVVESFRTFIGAHYPTDLIAGAGLAALAVWASQLPWPISVGNKVMRWAQSSPGLFYMTAFFFSYQIATLFNDIRQIVGPVRDHMLGH